MSLIPFLLEDLYPTSHHRFGTGYYPRHLWKNYEGIEKKSHIGKDGFEASLDVGHFQPNEITVKTDHHSIVIHAKHEEKQDEHGYISREFTRRYDLPEGFKPEDLISTLSSDGVLSIKCPKHQGSNVRHVQIQQTGPVKQSIKSNEEKKEGK
uniref:Small heat shock protein Hsp17.4 n=1 Tax=Sitodiplosis mosellana TaxID=263140 RepID=A0A5J6DC89_9DIPT|nr:small heat shock protein Hsp17.4 [Sitodiplosis mosellana]